MTQNNFYDYNYSADDGIYVSLNPAAIAEAEIDEALDAINIEGEGLVYKLIVDGRQAGTINIPEDQFLENVSYDPNTKEFVFKIKDGGEIRIYIGDFLDNVPTKLSQLENDANFITKDEADASYEPKGDYATQDWVNEQGFLKEHQDLSEYAKSADVAQEIATATEGMATEDWVNTQDFLKEHQDLSEYINGVIYETESKKIVFKHYESVIAEIDATPFIKDGMVDRVVVEGGNLVITFNVESGKETITIPLTSIFDPSNYYDKNSADDKFAAKTEVATGDNDVLTNILGRIWTNTDKEVSGYFKTRYTNADGSYAQIWNESDGGGSLYENKADNIKTFVGVNADNRDGVCAQIYSKDVTTNVGSRLNINPNGMFYGVGNSASTAAEYELAVKGDIATDRAEIDAIIAEKDATITKLSNDLYTLKKTVSDMGGAVTYDFPADGKSLNTLLLNNGTVKVTEDATEGRVGPGMMASNHTTLNLNGHTLVMDTTGNFGSILVRGTQVITIKGTGASRIENNGSGMIVWNASANSVVNLNSGLYYGNGEGSELIYCEKGVINITGGTYRTTNADKRYLLNCKDASFADGTAKILISSTSKTTGPKFYDFDPSNNPEGEGTTYVAEGNHVISSTVTEEGVDYTVYTVVKDA